jgi:tetratricopeptide (TPR) repeat protein
MQHDRSMRAAYYNAGLVHLVRGDIVQAIPLLERGRAISEKLGLATRGSINFLWHAYSLAGRFEESIPGLEETNRLALDSEGGPCLSLWIGWQAAAYLGAGRIADAERTAIEAIEMARKSRERGFEGEANCRLGEVVLQIEPFDPARAEGHFRDALAIAEELGMRPLQAHCHLGLGKVYRRAGRPHEARSELNVAIDLYLSMEMRHWLPEAEAELAAVASSDD